MAAEFKRRQSLTFPDCDMHFDSRLGLLPPIQPPKEKEPHYLSVKLEEYYVIRELFVSLMQGKDGMIHA